MDRTERVLALVGEHCDLEWRLGAVPPGAYVRGVFIANVASAMEQLGKRQAYEDLLGRRRYSALKTYPLTEWLVVAAGAGALVASPEEVHAGMEEIGRRHARSFSESLLGRALIRLLSPDPKRLLQQGAAARRQSTNTGVWELEFPEERVAHVRMREDYVWIESLQLGAAKGTFDMIRTEVEIECKLDDPFNGVHIIRW